MVFSYPTSDVRLHVPELLVHGTTNIAKSQIETHGIRTRGYNIFGKQKPPTSLDFGEGFYTTYHTKIGIQQATALAGTRAANIPTALPCIIRIKVHPDLNQDSLLKCVYFDGDRETDGLDWARFIVHHRVLKDKSHCMNEVCNGHPDVMIGPVANGNAISAYAEEVYRGYMSIESFYREITKSKWFPHYKQVVLGNHAIKYLSLV